MLNLVVHPVTTEVETVKNCLLEIWLRIRLLGEKDVDQRLDFPIYQRISCFAGDTKWTYLAQRSYRRWV